MVYGMGVPITQVTMVCILSKTTLKWMDDITVNRPVINRGNEQSPRKSSMIFPANKTFIYTIFYIATLFRFC